MAGDAARLGAVSVRLRRVAAGRAAQRLLVLAGLLIAGWLLGCAAQSAHADEMPAPAQVVARTPVLGEAVATVHQREPVHRVVRAVADKAPRTEPVQTPRIVAPPLQDETAVPVAEPKAPPPVVESLALPARRLDVPRVSPARFSVSPAQFSKVSTTRSVARPGSDDGVQHPAMPAPQRHGDHPDTGGLAGNGAPAGFPATAIPAVPAPPRAMTARVLGALPPAVRTAADEPSFAPD
ncbi:hypothetical protein [Actinomadura latina]|uniref:Uncharacterized protein n=1 Tax=Actinomadura latina TaxID=163603 RepID=A0A846YVS8_9ACTN|nr:hypothetical protein [Actinomadura latina]NKZ02772.1 hypothetical protein [Actinomadura latina]